MYNFIELLTHEIEDIKALYEITKSQLGRSRIGCLSAREHNGNTYYYEVWKDKGKVKQKYLGTEDDERVGTLVLKKVFQKRLLSLKHDLALLIDLKEQFMEYATDAILRALGSVYDIVLWNATSLKELEAFHNARQITGNHTNTCPSCEHSTKPFQRKIITCDGHLVRSKAECIIYDLLVAFHIKFEYEPRLFLYDENYNLIEINPDFYIECKDGSHIIIEHLGLLSDPDYAEIQVRKLRMYHLNGYDLGHNLIFTSDNEESGIDSEFIRDLIEHVVLKRAVITD